MGVFLLLLYNCVVWEIVNNNLIIIIVFKVQYLISSVDYQRRELTHACSRSDTQACDMCYVFNVNLTDSFDDRRSQCRLIE